MTARTRRPRARARPDRVHRTGPGPRTTAASASRSSPCYAAGSGLRPDRSSQPKHGRRACARPPAPSPGRTARAGRKGRQHAEIARWGNRIGETEGPLRAARAAAGVLAGHLPPSTAGRLRQITAGTELAAFDDRFRPVPLPQLPGIARALPADTSREIVRLAGRLGFTASDVLIEVANALTRQAPSPGSGGPKTASRLAAAGFPAPPLETRAEGEPVIEPARADRPRKHGSPRPQPAR